MANKDIMTKWVAALRSGEYKQGRMFLNNGEGSMCCLGVLCDMYAKDHPEAVWKPDPQGAGLGLDTSGHDMTVNSAMPPKTVVEWAGLEGVHLQYYSAKNDGGCDFETIADLIDTNLVKYPDPRVGL
jgi:hypothetical protein